MLGILLGIVQMAMAALSGLLLCIFAMAMAAPSVLPLTPGGSRSLGRLTPRRSRRSWLLGALAMAMAMPSALLLGRLAPGLGRFLTTLELRRQHTPYLATSIISDQNAASSMAWPYNGADISLLDRLCESSPLDRGLRKVGALGLRARLHAVTSVKAAGEFRLECLLESLHSAQRRGP